MEPTAQPPLAIVFGPVRSRRLGWSLGINNVPPKHCTYACVYCQVGATDHASSRRSAFFAADEIAAAVLARAEECRRDGVPVDYATFVPDGEPTLDLALGATIRLLRSGGLRVAVISNGSLLGDATVREEVAAADLVSVKVDTVDESVWRAINRPVGRLALPEVLDGIRRFAVSYRGDLLTETLVVAGLNDDQPSASRTARFVGALEPLHAYVTIPTRPPAEPWVRPPTRDAALRIADAFRAAEVPTTCLLDEAEDPFAPGTDPRQGLLAIAAVHPMVEQDARAYLERSGADGSVLDELVREGRLTAIRFRGRRYLRTARR
jgi:wyosine [tRNA(Phe)-imidazoG37] synthetase (radical SAM superfamily)